MNDAAIPIEPTPDDDIKSAWDVACPTCAQQPKEQCKIFKGSSLQSELVDWCHTSRIELAIRFTTGNKDSIAISSKSFNNAVTQAIESGDILV
jgi:hypothetical protein